jgi:hypothetical protein
LCARSALGVSVGEQQNHYCDTEQNKTDRAHGSSPSPFFRAANAKGEAVVPAERIARLRLAGGAALRDFDPARRRRSGRASSIECTLGRYWDVLNWSDLILQLRRQPVDHQVMTNCDICKKPCKNNKPSTIYESGDQEFESLRARHPASLFELRRIGWMRLFSGKHFNRNGIILF